MMHLKTNFRIESNDAVLDYSKISTISDEEYGYYIDNQSPLGQGIIQAILKHTNPQCLYLITGRGNEKNFFNSLYARYILNNFKGVALNFTRFIKNGPATIGFIDNEKYIVKLHEGDVDDPEKAMLMLYAKSHFSSNKEFQIWFNRQMKLMNKAIGGKKDEK